MPAQPDRSRGAGRSPAGSRAAVIGAHCGIRRVAATSHLILVRPPALLAVKIRCRSRRTSSSARDQSIVSQSSAPPSGPFAVTASNVPIGSGSPITCHAPAPAQPDPRIPGCRPDPRTARRRRRAHPGHAGHQGTQAPVTTHRTPGSARPQRSTPAANPRAHSADIHICLNFNGNERPSSGRPTSAVSVSTCSSC